MKWFKDVLTDNDGDWDIVSLLAAVAVVIALGLTVYEVVEKDRQFDIKDFGIGTGALIGSLGLAYYGKSASYRKSEDREKKD